MDITRISVSRKQVWDECEYKYKLKYHLKEPSPEEEPFYFIFGKIVHKIAEEYVNARGELTLNEVTESVMTGKIPLESYKEEVVFAPKKLPPEYKKRFPGMLKSIENLTKQIGFEGETEVKFEYDLLPPENKCVTGVIDRIVVRDGIYHIIDYKTSKKGKYRKNRQTITEDLQLRCYSRVIQTQYDVPAEKIKAALHYLEGGDLIGAQYSDRSLEAAEKDMLKAYRDIEEKEADAAWGRTGWHCNRCEYRSMCPHFRNKNNELVLPTSLR
ncbi:MAG: RecB family exonuclease [Candidatus Thorarchaeota archaeon]|jgi:ATP-dependent helicase/DNAse subunit B